MGSVTVIRPESPESDITATSRIRTSGSFRLIHIDEFGVDRDLPALSELSSSVRHGYIRLGESQTQIGQVPSQILRRNHVPMNTFNTFRHQKAQQQFDAHLRKLRSPRGRFSTSALESRGSGERQPNL